ncbi:hypothetical protein AGMMS49965_11460 [Bacteroidia bacterium]|nr:hypothetical protein AGMMS4957_01550 [Bacteroidia bacterium]GHT41525.1 hypothetical protein AGMMS49965_11460 [Bacteroidia bacterium]
MDKKELVFGKTNFILLAIAIGIIIVGFALMAGGKTTEAGGFDPSIFSTRRITVAPIVTLMGFGLVVYAILFKEKEPL